MISFESLKEAHLEQVLKWRTSEHVTKYMYTDIEYDMNKQYAWFLKIQSDSTQSYWIIKAKDIPIGLVSIYDIDLINRKACYGYYIGNLDYAPIASRVHPYVYNYLFFELGFNKIIAEVMEGNEGIVKMHLFYGYTQQGLLKEHMYKYNQFFNVIYLELLASTWKDKMTKHHRFVTRFS